MSTATAAPRRRISFGSLLLTIFSHQVRTALLSRKTIFLGLTALLPALGAVFYLLLDGKGGVDFYSAIIDNAVMTFLLPLVCLFYGGPAVVEEIEGRTITYLFLRPISKPAIYLGKLGAAIVASLAVMVPATIIFYILSMLAGGSIGDSIQFGLQTFVGVALGCISYTATFAAAGALFSRSILGGILYWVVIEVGLSIVPVLEYATQKFHLRNVANLIDFEDISWLESMIIGDNPIIVPIWASFLIIFLLISALFTLGTLTFNNKQYLV